MVVPPISVMLLGQAGLSREWSSTAAGCGRNLLQFALSSEVQTERMQNSLCPEGFPGHTEMG